MVAVALGPDEARPGFSSNTNNVINDGSSTPSSSSISSPSDGRHQPAASQQSSSHNTEWLNGAKTATAGGIAGAFAKSCTAPLARLTILYQVQGFTGSPSPAGHAAVGTAAAAAATGAPAAPPGLRQAFMQVVRREGPAALWKGNLVTILHRLPYSSINFYTYERTQKLLQQTLPGTTDFARAWMAGATAGLVACSAAYPLDLVRTRLAAQTHGHYYHGISSTLRCIVADEGVVGLYRGLGATLLQVVPSLALNFSLYNSIRNSCMAVHQRMQQLHKQRQLAAVVQAAAAEARGSHATGGSSSGSSNSAHSLAVASSVDQGLSLSQMLLWHLDDARDAAAEAYASSSSGGSSSTSDHLSADVDAAGAAERRSSQEGASSSSTSSSSSLLAADSSSSSSTRIHSADVPAGISLASGCVSGFLTATATFPLDVIRRRMQVYGRQHQGQAVSYSQIMRQITSQCRGLRGFYVGILPEYCKVVPGVAIAFCTYEQLKQWMRVQP